MAVRFYPGCERGGIGQELRDMDAFRIKAVGLKRWEEQRGLAMGIGTMAGRRTNIAVVVIV